MNNNLFHNNGDIVNVDKKYLWGWGDKEKEDIFYQVIF